MENRLKLDNLTLGFAFGINYCYLKCVLITEAGTDALLHGLTNCLGQDKVVNLNLKT
jgi:hypothetical protein